MGVDVEAWLRELGLAQYEQAFRDNAIDPEILPRLTADDLKDMGVTVVGHRRKLLDAIGALRAGAESPPSQAARTDIIPAPSRTVAAPAAQAERRQLTVMFVDLVGSTGLSSRLDPEEMGELIRAYQNLVAGEVTRFEGHVAKYMGDGVLAYFGWPRAHEDEVERAVRAGLAIAAAVPKAATPGGEPLAAWVGIATGPVVVGDLIGDGEVRERAVVGVTPNLAARLQGLADPGAVVIAEGTRRLLGDLFAYRDLGAKLLKGFAEPVSAFAVLGPGAAEGRFDALHSAGVMLLVGREHELALLLDRWALAKEGEGQVVQLAGEPGIGKSRLVHALRERLAAEAHTPLSQFCSPYHTNTALHPVVGLLERATGLRRDDPPQTQLDQLEAMLRLATEDVREATPILADLLAIQAGDRYPPLELSPQRKKERTFQVLLDQLAGLAKRSPVLTVYEDVHWADPTTLELLGRVVERVQRLRVLVLVTYRPSFVPPWTAHGHVTALSLSRLGRRQGEVMVGRIASGKALPAAVLEQILTRTDGVPLFVEELTKTVLASGLLRDEGDRYELGGPLPPLAIPSTLHDSLMARLDRLATVKEVAQIAAVIGRQFSYDLLAAVTSLGGNELREALERLSAEQLIFRGGEPPDATYTFKHALVRDAAYQSLLKGRRQQLHARIATVLEEHFPEIVDAEPELLAQHCAEAGLTERAVEYRCRASQRALARSAMAESAAQLRQGLALVATLPPGSKRQRRELDLQLALGGVLIGTKGGAAVETDHAYVRAHELCLETGAAPELFNALFGRFVVNFQRGQLGTALETARELLSVAEQRNDLAAQVSACRVMGAVSFQLGKLDESRAHLTRGLALYDPERDQASRYALGMDSRVVCLYWLSQVLLTLGYADQAQALAEEAILYARRLAQPSSVAYALCSACFLYQRLGQSGAVRAAAEPLITLYEEQGFPLWGASGRIIHGWALADSGRSEEGLAEIRRGLVEYVETGAEIWLPDFLAMQAEMLGRVGQTEAGLRYLSDALDRGRRRWIEPELHRLKGELLLALPEADTMEAEACFRHAIAMAREHGARMLELRGAMGLARLWHDGGRARDAQELLAPLYAWFAEGFDTPDLNEAKALLDGLPVGALRYAGGRETRPRGQDHHHNPARELSGLP
jgi:class 3 adenylate cyclase/predicted ATPase